MERLDGTLEKLDNNQSIIIKLNRKTLPNFGSAFLNCK